MSDTLLLDADQAVHPLADGVYVRDGDPSDRYRVGLGSDGWYRVERFNANGTIGETRRALFTPLPSDGPSAYAIAEETDDGFVYAVAHLSNGRVQLATPDCADPLDRNLAIDQGGIEDDDEGMSQSCAFRSRAALFATLTAFAGQADFGRPYQRH